MQQQILWYLLRLRTDVATLIGANQMSSIAVSNLTNAVVAMSAKVDLLVSGFDALKNELKAELQTITQSNDDSAIQAAADNITQNILPRMDQVVTGLQSETASAKAIADQIPQGTAAGTTGAAQTVASGMGVQGTVGNAQDTSSGARVGSGATPSDPANEGIVGIPKADVSGAGSTAGTGPDNDSSKGAADGTSTGSASA